MKSKPKNTKKRKPKFKTGKVHLWLGLLSGFFVFWISLSGCVYVFAPDFQDYFRKDVIYVKPEKKTLPLDQLWENTQQTFGKEKKIGWVHVYNAPDKSWVFYTYKRNETGWNYFQELAYYEAAYVNPYTGKVLRIYDEKMDFFSLVKMFHWSFFLKDSIGSWIVGLSTLIFVIMLFTGLYLWWPNNKAARKQRFSFKWKDTTRWKRKNYDLHNILGFYIGSVATIIAVTGLVWAFSWVQSLVYIAGSLSITPPDFSQAKSEKNALVKTNILEDIKNQTSALYVDYNGFNITSPADEKAESVYNVNVQKRENHFANYDQLQFDRKSAKLLKIRKHQDKNNGEKLVTANYDIHVGAILGLPGKILAFIVSLICTSLPLTGFFIWWGRRKKAAK